MFKYALLLMFSLGAVSSMANATEMESMNVKASCFVVTNEDVQSKVSFTPTEVDKNLTKEEKNDVSVLQVKHENYRLDLLANQKNGDLVSLRSVLSKNNQKLSETDFIVSFTERRDNNYNVLTKLATPSFNLSIYDNGKKVRGYCNVIAIRE